MSEIQPQAKIQKVSKVMRMACGAMGAILVLLFIVGISMVWAGIGYLSVNQPGLRLSIGQMDGAPANGIAMSNISVAGRLLLTLGYSLLIALLFKAVLHLYMLFTDYSHGEIFTADTAKAIKHLGITICLWAALPVLDAAIKVSLFLMERQNGMPGPTINAGVLPVAGWLFVGTAVVIVSWVMDTGREMSDDQKFMV